MKRCCVPGCKNTSNLRMVPFTDGPRWEAWLIKCPFLSKYSCKSLDNVRICEIHFLPQFIINQRLTSDAIPTLNLPNKLNKRFRIIYSPALKESSGDPKPQLNKSSEEQQLTGKEQHSSNLKVMKNKSTSDVVPSLHLQLPLKGLNRDLTPQINKSSSEEQQLGRVHHSSNIKARNQDKKLIIEPTINVDEFSLNPSSFIYVPSSPINLNENESVGIDTDLVNMSPDGHQESVSKQESPPRVNIQTSSAMTQNYKIIRMPQLVNLNKQCLNTYNPCLQNFPTRQPITVKNNINKLNINMLPETIPLKEQNSSTVPKDVETKHFENHNSKVKEESFDNINGCISRLKYICYTCLSEDRNLTKLADIHDGINNLLYLVSCSGEVYEELSNYVDEVYICWECKALMNRFRRFRDQVCNAQQQLKDINDNKYRNLSNLSTTHHKNFYNYEYIITEDTTNETEPLNPEEDLSCEELPNRSPLPSPLPNRKQNGRKNNGYIVDNNTHYLTIQMSATELSEDLHIRKADPDFVATTHKCTTCIKTFNDEEELNKHVSDYHKVPHHVKCYICETYVRSDWHKEHNDSHFVKYKCHRCYKDFYSSLEILEHLYQMHDVKETFEEIISKKLHTMKELRVKPLVLYSPSGRTFCYICSRCNQCYVSKTEIDMRCEPCNKILETIEPKYGKDSKYHVIGENNATGKNISKDKINIEPTKNITKLQTPDDDRNACSSHDKLLCAKLDQNYFKDTTKHIIYDHGYAKTPKSDHNQAKTDNNRSLLLKLDSSNTDTGQINFKNKSDESHLIMECTEEYPDIVKSISGQHDIGTVDISDIENDQNARYVMCNLSEFLKIPAISSNFEITKQETDITEQATEVKTDITEEITEIKTEITESETKVTEERFEEDFVLDPDNPTYKLISKYKAHYTVIKMTVTEMQDSLEQRKLVPNFTEAMYKCELCIEIFNNHQEKLSHILHFHVKPTSIFPYKLCDICRVYIKERWLKEHRNNHFLKFFCHYCDFMANNVLVIWKHLKVEHTCKVYSDKEDSWLKRRIKLTNPGTCPLNVDIKANEKSFGYICLECDKLFPTLALKMKHNRLFHRKYCEDAPKHKCSKCSKTFRRVVKLKEHELKHKLPPVFKTCSVCKKQVTNMRIHMRIHRGPPMSCTDCDRVYPNRAAYLNHMRYTMLHVGDKHHKYKCNFCDKRFTKKATRRDHINYTHKGIAYECSLCHKMLSSAAQMCTHMNNVHRRAFRQYLCPTCGIVCKNIKVLRDHELYHSGKHVTCHLCGIQFRKYSSLRNHRHSAHKNVRARGKDAVVVENIEQ